MPDHSEFEQIYQALPSGLVIVACGGGSFRPLQSFCFSLKGAAIRKGANAMHFNWDCSRENWDSLGGIQHFRDFIDLYHSQGVRVFLIDGSPQSGSLTHRTAELVRSPRARGSIENDIAALIHQEALAKNVTVIVTALAEVVAAEQTKKALEDLDSAIHEKQRGLAAMREGMSTLEREFGKPNAEADIAALPKDIAEQLREAREFMPKALLAMQKAEADITELSQVRKRLKRKRSPSQLLDSIRTNLYSGSWKGILLGQDRINDDWYSATVATGLTVESYGPLDFLWECPQPPEVRLHPEFVAGRERPPAVFPSKRLSWLRRLFR